MKRNFLLMFLFAAMLSGCIADGPKDNCKEYDHDVMLELDCRAHPSFFNHPKDHKRF